MVPFECQRQNEEYKTNQLIDVDGKGDGGGRIWHYRMKCWRGKQKHVTREWGQFHAEQKQSYKWRYIKQQKFNVDVFMAIYAKKVGGQVRGVARSL